MPLDLEADIVPTVLFEPLELLPWRFVRTNDFAAVNLHRFERVASFLKLDPKWVLREVKETVESALQVWPAAMPELLGEKRAAALLNRLETLRLVEEVRRN